MKIFNIKYLIFLFLIICSLLVQAGLFFTVVPVFAQEETSANPCTATEDTLKKEEYRGSTFKPSEILPLCVYFEGTDLEKTCGCRNVNVFVSLLTKIAKWLFGIVGAVALAVFIYGGFTILTAAGSAERVKKGKDALLAAVIGLVIIFTAQVGMRFLVDKVILAGSTTAKLEEKGLNINFK